MPPSFRTNATLLLLAGIIGSVCCLLRAAGPETAPPTVRRVFLSAQKLAEEMGRPKRGPLVALPRDDFESLVRRGTNPTEPPRLVEAAYEAVLVDGDLVGTARWQVVQTGNGLLPLGPFNLALTRPPQRRPAPIPLAVGLVGLGRWAPLAAVATLATEVPVGDFDGKGSALLLEGPARHTLDLTWKARGEARPDGWHYDLRWPAAPAAYLDLIVPGDTTVSAPEKMFLAGPLSLPSGDRRNGPPFSPNDRRWRLYCGGMDQAEIILRPARPGPIPLPLVHTLTTQTICPDAVEARFELDVEVLHQGLKELIFECDAGLEPYDVTGRHIEGWEMLRGTPRRLVVRLREPLHSDRFTIDCLAPPRTTHGTGPTTWTSPSVRLAGAVDRGETLLLRLHPDLQMEHWHAGDFRLENAETVQDAERGPLHQLTLRGGGLLADPLPGEDPNRTGAPRRPTALVQPAATSFGVRQVAWWQIAAGRQTLTVALTYEIWQGQIARQVVRLPLGWEVDSVKVGDPGLASRSLRTSLGRNDLIIDLKSPLLPPVPGKSRSADYGTLVITLHPATEASGGGLPMSFPDAVPLGARYRRGMLAIDAMTGRESVTLRSSVAEGPADEGPRGARTPMVCYPYRGESPHGTLILRPQTPEPHVRCHTDVIVHGQQASVESRLQIEAEAGCPQGLDFTLSAADAGAWQWQAGAGTALAGPPRRRVEAEVASALATLADASPLSAAAVQVARPAGQMWHVDFARRLEGLETLTLVGSVHANPPGGPWTVSLPSVPGASRLDGTVTLYSSSPIGVELLGLRAEAPGHGPGRSAARTFRYSQGSPGLTLLLPRPAAERTAAGQPPPAALTDEACLTTTYGLANRLHHRFVFRLAGWSDPTLFLGLPAGAQPQAVRVDGVWLDHLRTEGEGIRLPVPGNMSEGVRDHHYEILYDTPSPTIWAGAALNAPVPTLQPPPLHVRRVWRLPSDIQPLSGAAWRRLPGPGAGRNDDGLKQPSDLFRLLGPPRDRLAGQTSDAEERQALADAALGLRSTRNGKPLPLRDVLTEITSRVLSTRARDRLPLVVDARALAEIERDAGYLIPLAPVGTGDPELLPWEKDDIGLVTLTGRSATLLTTRQQLETWNREGAGLPGAVEEAVAEAARSGHDVSGRYRALWDWPDSTLATSIPLAGSWSEWEPATEQAGDNLLVVRTSAVQLGAASVTVVALLLIWRPSGRSCRLRLAILALLLGLTGLALWWLPTALQPLAWWPFLAVAAAALLWHLYVAWMPPAATRTKRIFGRERLLSGAVVLVIYSLLGGQRGPLATRSIADSGTSDPSPGTWTVFVVPNTPGPGETVYAPPELLDLLRSRNATTLPQGAVVVAADYDGKIVGNVATVQAMLRTWNTGPGTLVPLPFENIALDGEVKVDGERVFPVALSAPQSGLAVPTRGAGAHEIRFGFKVPVLPSVSGDDVEMQFAGPHPTINHLKLRLPNQATAIQAIGRQGAQRVQPSNEGPTLDADLGSQIGPVTVRWSMGAQSPRSAQVQFREAWLWSLRPEANALSGWLNFQLTQGTTTHLEVQVPNSLVVRSATAPRLREWHVVDEGRDRLLHLEFTGPLSGEVGVALELVPRFPFPANIILPLPTPRGQAIREAGYLAYRTDGEIEAQRQPTLNLTGLAQKDLFAPFWPKAQRPSQASFEYACVFGSADGKRPILPLHLRLVPPLATVHQNITMTVRANQADLRATLDLTSSSGDLAMVRWDLRPGRPRWYQPRQIVTVARVTGRDVRRWSQDGDQLIIWLEGGKPTTPIELTGWLSLTPTPEGARLDLPRLTVPGARTTSTIHLIADSGVTLEPIDLHQLTPLAPEAIAPVARLSGLDPQALARAAGAPSPPDTIVDVYKVIGADTSASWRVRPSNIQPNVQIATVLDIQGRQRTFETHIEVRFPRYEARSLTVRMRGGDWPDVSLTAAREIRRRELRPVAGERSWQVDLAPSTDEVRRLTLTGGMPLGDTSAGWAAPDVTLVETSRAERILVLATPELAVQAPPQGMEALAPARLPPWIGDVERLRRPGTSAWLVTGPAPRLQLGVARDRPTVAPARLFLADNRADFAEGRGWLFQTTFTLWQDTSAELSATWPANVKVLALEIDGYPQPPEQTEGGTLWLPMATTQTLDSMLRTESARGARQVRLWWRWDDSGIGMGAHTRTRPRLEGPRLAGVAPGPAVWTVLVPPGCALSQYNGLAAGPGAAAAVALSRAEAHLELALASKASETAPSDGPRSPDAVAARAATLARLATELRRAEQALAMAGDMPVEKGPRGQTLAEWLAGLRERQRTLKAPSEIEIGEIDDTLVGQGTPYRGRLGPADPPPGLTISFRSEAQPRWSMGLWLGALAGLTLLAFFPVVWPVLRPLWPEQFGAMAVLGWLAVGPTPVVLLLLLAWAAGRLAGILGLVVLLRRRRPNLTLTALSRSPSGRI